MKKLKFLCRCAIKPRHDTFSFRWHRTWSAVHRLLRHRRNIITRHKS